MAEGERVIELFPQREPGQRWDGHLDGDSAGRHWAAGTIQNVIEQMDRALGPQPEAEYRIREGGA